MSSQLAWQLSRPQPHRELLVLHEEEAQGEQHQACGSRRRTASTSRTSQTPCLREFSGLLSTMEMYDEVLDPADFQFFFTCKYIFLISYVCVSIFEL
jgi:hypothetical protein